MKPENRRRILEKLKVWELWDKIVLIPKILKKNKNQENINFQRVLVKNRIKEYRSQNLIEILKINQNPLDKILVQTILPDI